VARIYGLKVSGVVGILTRAKLAGKIESLLEELERLRNDGGFWIGKDVFNRALKALGET
jgi:predicted nucleic acid-binding protein